MTDERSQFVREQRYIVVKIKDLASADCTPEELDAFRVVCGKVIAHRIKSGKDPLECVVVEKDWKCYEPTWAAVQAEWQAARAAPALHIDDAECVMYDAMRAAHQRGPVTDDKVLLDELAKRGVVLTRAAPAQPEGKPK
jgi:hypothetical protein